MSSMTSSNTTMGLDIAGTAMKTVGQLAQGDATVAAARRDQAYAAYQAAQLRQNAEQQIAASQRNAEADKMRLDYALSSAVAHAAAGGGTSTDPGVVSILSRVEAQGAYQIASDLYSGKEAARGMRSQATATEYGASLNMSDAQSARSAKQFGAATTLLKGAAGIYDKYAKVGPGAA